MDRGCDLGWNLCRKNWAGHKFTLKSNMLTLDGISVEEVGLSQMHTEVEHNDLGPWMKSV